MSHGGSSPVLKKEPKEESKSKKSRMMPRESSSDERERKPRYKPDMNSNLKPVNTNGSIKSEPKQEPEADSYPRSVKSERGMSTESREGGEYCQALHLPHPPTSELSPLYVERLRLIQAAIHNPKTSVEVLNTVVDLILETGNFITENEQFVFDVCNLDVATVTKIETVMGFA